MGFKPETCGHSLFRTFPFLSILAFFLGLLASTLLNTFFLCRDTWNNIVKWVVDDTNRPDFWWAVVEFQGLITRSRAQKLDTLDRTFVFVDL